MNIAYALLFTASSESAPISVFLPLSPLLCLMCYQVFRSVRPLLQALIKTTLPKHAWQQARVISIYDPPFHVDVIKGKAVIL